MAAPTEQPQPPKQRFKRRSDNKKRLIDAATGLFHHQGFDRTTLADIAKRAGFPLGNVYYYFKTKTELARAVIEQRSERFQRLFREWEALPTPQQRLIAFLKQFEESRGYLSLHGCPVGSLSQELMKRSHAIGDEASVALAQGTKEIFEAQRRWAEGQFRLMGAASPEQRAETFLAQIQGAALLANSLEDPSLISKQLRRLEQELQGS